MFNLLSAPGSQLRTPGPTHRSCAKIRIRLAPMSQRGAQWPDVTKITAYLDTNDT